MPRILVVDHDRGGPEGLRNLVRGDGLEWDITVANGNDSAEAMLEMDRFDVVVSELRGAGIDGASLLKFVQEHYPGTVRIVLTGSTELDSRLRVVSYAHQFLIKPCNPIELRNVIVRTTNLQTLLDSPAIRNMIGKVSNLPSVPRLFTTLQMKLEDPNASAQEIAAIIEKDPAMAAKILQIVNSAYFGLSRNITSVRDAVAMVGFRMVKNLVLSAEVFRSFSDHGQGLGVWIESLQAHSLLTARIAAGMFQDRRLAEDAFMAAVLHDAGKLVLATQQPKYLKEVLAVMRVRNEPMYVIERELVGITHAEIGGYLLGLWGLPYPTVEAVANHHSPRRVEQLRFDLLAAVHIADLLANEQSRATPGIERAGDEIDPEYLEALGVAGQLPAWRALVVHEAEARSLRA